MESSINHSAGLRLAKLVSHVPDGMHVCLYPKELFKIQRGRRPVKIICQKGSLWITLKGDQQDHLLQAGEEFVITNPGLVLVEGLPEAKLTVVPEQAR